MDALTTDDPPVLGRYTLLGRLGEGGQGIVYLGKATDGQQVAVKALNPRLVANPEALRRFAGEVDHVRQVSSFCVAEVLDADLTGERPYIVSEYVEGQSLQEAVTGEGPRGPGQLRRLAVGTMTALAAIHTAGIVHRDFKPHNVLLGTDGPRVIDFGIARVLGSQATAVGQIIGTAIYMAPEQIQDGEIGPAADLFAWASTITFAACGRPPFGTGRSVEVMYRIVNEEPDLPPLPADLRAVLLDCLAKDAAARPTARDVLLRLIGDQPTAPNGHTTFEDGEPTIIRPPLTPTLVEPPSTQPARKTGHRTRPLIIGATVTALVAAAALAIALRPDADGSVPSAAKMTGTPLYEETFSEQPDWDGYRFVPAGAPDQRTLRGYEPDRGDFAMLADTSYPRNPALSPIPAKDATTPERNVMFGALATVREARGQGEIGLLCRWDEDDGSGYLFLVALDGGARAVRYAQGISTKVGTGKVKPLETGRPVRLQASCRSDTTATHLTFWVNGTELLRATDTPGLPPTPRSQVGLSVQVPEAGDNKLIAAFDDFAVTRP